MNIKSYDEFLNEASGIFIPNATGAISTNSKSQETGKLKSADKDDEDPYNPSIINKFAATVAGGNVAFVSKNKPTPGRGITTKRGIKEAGSTELEVGTAVEMEHTKDPKEAEKIAKDHLAEDPNYYIKLYKAGLIDEPKAIKLVKKLIEGGLGDNQIAGQRVFTQTVDKSKQGYQDAMYYEDDDDDREIGVIDEQVLDDAVYSNEKRNHNDPELKLDELPLFDPPKNSSDETKRELLYLSTLQRPSKFDMDQDKNFTDTFSNFLKSKGFDISNREIYDYSHRIKAIVGMIKNHYNRPRPIQLAKYLNIDIKPAESVTASTPSYPSGHATQPYAIATALSYKYPNLSNDLFKLADEIATSRLRMRLHYPSDYEYGKRLGLYIGQKLKMK